MRLVTFADGAGARVGVWHDSEVIGLRAASVGAVGAAKTYPKTYGTSRITG
jgi:hypothetical protein